MTFYTVNCDSLNLEITSSRGEPHAEIVGSYFIRMPFEQTEHVSRYPEVNGRPMMMNLATGSEPRYEIMWFEPQTVAGFIYTPGADVDRDIMYRYVVQISDDGKTWTDVPTIGEFGNIAANPIPQEVIFSNPVKTRAIRLVCRETVAGESFKPEWSDLQFLAPASK